MWWGIILWECQRWDAGMICLCSSKSVLYSVLFRITELVLLCEFMQNGTRFFFRGQRIWEAVMNELLFKGLRKAKQVITCKHYCFDTQAQKLLNCMNQSSIIWIHELIVLYMCFLIWGEGYVIISVSVVHNQFNMDCFPKKRDLNWL